jgi:hypothetical protein
MKKTVYIIAIFAVFLGGCEDFLDRKPLGQQTTESFLGNPAVAEQNFEQMIHACYSVFYASENSLGQHNHHGEWMYGDWLSDDCEKGGNGAGDFPEVLDWRTWSILPSAASHENNCWRVSYVGIARANAVLKLVEDYKDNLSEAVYNRIKGEGLFVRAYFYFYLAKVYGSVPYFDSPVLPDQYKNPPKMAPEELYAKIDADLVEATALVPEKNDFPSGVWPGGRATRGAVRAVLARVITMEIGFGFNGRTWQDVYDVTKAIIDANQYLLASNYATIFEMEGEQNSESVFEIECADFSQPYGAPGGNLQVRMVTFRPNTSLNAGKNLTTGGWGFSCPSKNLVAEFEAGDPRMPCTVISNGDRMWEDGDPATDEVILTVEDDDCPTGYWFRKYCSTIEDNPSNNTDGKQNMRKVRYAEVLLTYAEAAFHTNREDEARQYVNMVRERARNSTYPLGSEDGNTGYPAKSTNPDLLPDVTATGAALLTAIKHERRVELGIEGNRAWDLIRWGEYEDAIRKYIAEDHFLKGGSPEQAVSNYRTHLIDGKVPSFPIPPDEVESYGVEQNPGY